MKACPYCAEEIQDAAVKCRYCGELLTQIVGRCICDVCRVARNFYFTGSQVIEGREVNGVCSGCGKQRECFATDASGLPRSSERVATYGSEQDLRRGISDAESEGYVVVSVTDASGHVNVGRTAAKVLLTGGLGIFLGASRTRSKVIVTYRRA